MNVARMRCFKVRVSKNPDVSATVRISDFHLKIYKEILSIKTDRGFGISLTEWIKEDLATGNHPKVTKALLENNLSSILAAVSAGHLKTFFSDDDVEITEASDDERGVPVVEEAASGQEGNVVHFIGEE
jgi:hypothetical protein